MHRHSYFFNALIDRERYRLFKHARLSLTYIVRVMIILFMYPYKMEKRKNAYCPITPLYYTLLL